MMKRLIFKYKQVAERSKGQALILIAITFVGMLAFVGLATDVGMLFINYGHLRRAVDAASLAAAAQIREGRSETQVTAAATQTMHLNGIDPATVIVQQCDQGDPDKQDLCLDPPVKLVRVIGQTTSPLAFLQLVGVTSFPLTASAVAEAASLDVILVIDVSQSMAEGGAEFYGEPGNENLNDPTQCNTTNTCQPFERVKEAAQGFAENILNLPAAEEADRLAIVTFSNGWETGATTSQIGGSGWTYDRDEAVAAIQGLNVYEGYNCEDGDEETLGNCRYYDDGEFAYWMCPPFENLGDYSTCPTTNIGGGLLVAANLFTVEERPNALRVVVLLTDGTNNATSAAPDDCEEEGPCTADHIRDNLPFGYCPQIAGNPQCRDNDVLSRTVPDEGDYPFCPPAIFETSPGDNLECPAEYDADDFTKDIADFLACASFNPEDACRMAGQGAIIFTIGMGDYVIDQVDESGWRAFGAYLLRYIANVGDNGDPDSGTDLCADYYDNNEELKTDCGNYYYIQDVVELPAVFEAIASRIFTRLAR